MNKLKTIILAAGEGKRMKSKMPKVLHKVLGKTMIDYVIDVGNKVGSDEIIVVIGHLSDIVQSSVKKDVFFVKQEQQLGTGHAVKMAENYINDSDDILILYGDTPLITEETINKVIKLHRELDNYVTLVSAIVDDPKGYGRIVRENNILKGIVEDKDATKEQQNICEINTGIYCFKGKALLYCLDKIKNNNAQGEFYLTDAIEILIKQGLKSDAYVAESKQEFLGVNDRIQLFEVASILRERINKKHMLEGVTFVDSRNTYISIDSVIGEDTVIYPNVIIEGKTIIGNNCVIGSNTKIIDSTINNFVVIESSHILNSTINDGSTIGPFAYLRPNSVIGSNCRIGDFVEIKNSEIGDSTKVSHLTYIGDSILGKKVNIGCGTVTVNYDGLNKSKTVIEDGAFIGCNTNLIAPVVVGTSSYIAAGSTITDDIPSNSLAIARVKQVVKENWQKKKK